MSEKVAAAKLQQQGAEGSVLLKLIVFAVALAVVPIGSYFLSLRYFFEGNTTYSAITAVVGANVVLISYIILSIREEAALNQGVHVGKPFQAKKDQ